MFSYQQNGHCLIIALYVDDLLIASSSMSLLSWIKIQLSSRFKMQNLGEARLCLGFEIHRDHANRAFTLGQSRYATKVIERFGMLTAHSCRTPLETNVNYLISVEAESTKEPYREAIGSLMYLMVGTRPDLAFSVGLLSKFVERPCSTHLQAVKRVLRYLIGTKNAALVFGRTSNNLIPEVFVDADWAGDVKGRKLTSGYVVLMGGAAVSWCSRKEEVVALSSAEAEYISLCSATKEAVWIRRLVFGVEIMAKSSQMPLIVQTDNQKAIDLANNGALNRRNKHIDVRYHFPRQALDDNIVKLCSCPATKMLADMFTKRLGWTKLIEFLGKIGLKSVTSQ